MNLGNTIRDSEDVSLAVVNQDEECRYKLMEDIGPDRETKHLSLRQHPDSETDPILSYSDDSDNDAPSHGDTDEPGSSSSSSSSSFIGFFKSSNGPPQVLFINLILALVIGSTSGIIPAVMSNRYARLEHGFEGDCVLYDISEKPQECLEGAADAMNAAAYSSFFSNGFTFVSSSLVGSISDEKGRRGLLLLGLFLSSLAPICLVVIQLRPTMSPTWYYSASSLGGLISWMSISQAAMSDVVPPKWRAASFGLLLAGFMMGFASAPMLALFFTHLSVSILSSSLLLLTFAYALFRMPETLSSELMEQAIQARQDTAAAAAVSSEEITTTRSSSCRRSRSSSHWIKALLRPATDLLILNRNTLFRFLSALAFFSGMSSNGNQSLLLYYIEAQLQFNEFDVALLLLLMGSFGILVQAILLKPLNDCLGERNLLFLAFSLGAIHNVMYGLATKKGVVYAAIVVGCLSNVSFPIISAVKSNNVGEHEQGRIQGALFSISSLASAVGPLSLKFVYHWTKDKPYPGPGCMFIFSAGLYVMAAICAYLLPTVEEDQANHCNHVENDNTRRRRRRRRGQEGRGNENIHA